MKGRPLVAFFCGLAPYPPPLYGGTLRIDRLIRGLLEEFDVALLCQTPVSTEELTANWDLGKRLARIVCVPPAVRPHSADALWGSVSSSIVATAYTALPSARPRMFDWSWSPEFVEQARRMLRELPVSVVWAGKSWIGEMARAAGAEQVIVDHDDFHGGLFADQLSRAGFFKRKPLHWVQAAHLKRYERRLLRRFEMVAVCKNDDRSLIDDGNGNRVRVVPNGVDIPEFIQRPNRPSPELLFVGTLSYTPNVDALISLANDILPAVKARVPGARLSVAGRAPRPAELDFLLDRIDIELHESPLSLEPFYQRAAICVAPLTAGGGTSIKVLESLAHGVPTVASSIAARGLGLRSGEHLMVADGPAEFAEACAILLDNPGLARELALRGRAAVSERFSWKAAGIAARAAVHDLLAGNHKARAG